MGASRSGAGIRVLACGLLTDFIGCADAPDEEIEVCAAIELALTVTDYRGDSTTRTTVIDVFQNNNRPEPQFIENRTARGGEIVILDASGSTDDDGDELSYAWYQEDGPRVELRESDTPRVEFTAPDPGATPIVLRFGFIVHDGTDESYPGYATVTIEP